MLTTSQSTRIFGMLMLAYPSWGEQQGEKIDGTLELYHRALRDIDAPLLEAAALQHISMSKWFPTVFELREAALSIITHGDESAEEAWGEVKKEIARAHIYKPYQFSNKKIECAVKIIGWETLCLQTIDDEPANRKHFWDIYKSLQHREHYEQIALPEVRQAIERLSEQKRLPAISKRDEPAGA